MFNESDLEKVADDIWKDRRITSPTYCEQCGYNLRTLPYIYNCPECGNAYNARALVLKGIFTPRHGMAPTAETSLVVIWAGMGWVIWFVSPRPLEPAIVGVVVACAGLCALSLSMAVRGWRKLILYKSVEARILREEEEG